MNPILRITGDGAGIVINDDFSATLTDLKSGTDWAMHGTCYQEIGPLSDEAVWNRRERCYMDRYPSFFRAQPLGGSRLRVTILDPLREPRGSFECGVSVDDGWIVFDIKSIDEALPSLIFPPFIESESLVVPEGIGRWYRKPVGESYYIMPASGWNMRWFGGLRGDNGWMAVVDRCYEDCGLYMSAMTACAGWQKVRGAWGYDRRLRIGFTADGYNGMAKRFRRYAMDHGLFKSLREKIAEVPAVGNLIGGRCVQFFQSRTVHAENSYLWMGVPSKQDVSDDGKVKTLIPHAEAAAIMEAAQAAGMKRGYFNLRGWLRGGYDEYHPDVWPPEKSLGSVEQFSTLLKRSDPFVSIIHDNYQDMYSRAPSFPDGVQRTSDGRLKAGGTWDGGRCYVVNTAKALEYARRNWEQFKAVGLRGIFLDTIGGAHFQEDYCGEHPMTRIEDAEGKLAIAKFFRSQGLVIGTEYGSDFSCPHVDFIETRINRVPGVTIPLWCLVYHDAAVMLRYRGGTDDQVAAGDDEDLLWGLAKMWPAVGLESFRRRAGDFTRSLRVDELHARIGLDEMTGHRYLGADGTIERTEFASGVAVTGNFSGEPAFVEGKEFGPGVTVG